MLGNKFKATVNKRGWAIEELDEFSRQFVEAAATHKDDKEYCLEIGAAFGFATIEALKLGVKMIANDVEAKHLKAIADNAPEQYRPNLKLMQGEFPHGLNLVTNSIRHALICRVTHYFTPDIMNQAITELFRIIKPGGKVFLVSETPYGAVFKSFIPLYEIRKEDESCSWPGFIEDLPQYMEKFSEDNPKTMLLLGVNELKREFERVGFEIEKCAFFSRKGVFPPELCLDGKESVGLVAKKPTTTKASL